MHGEPLVGAAGLLFSALPGASVTTVKNALLDNVDVVGSLSGKTVTGGRLNVARALAGLASSPGGGGGGGDSGTGSTATATATTTTTSTGNGGAKTISAAGCTVPNVKGKSRTSAEKALKKAGCKLGKVFKPKKKKKGKPLGAFVVKASTPAAGTTLAAGSAVDLKLKKKPKAKAKKKK